MFRSRMPLIQMMLPALGFTLLCNNWLLALALNPRLSTSKSLISEISAGTQPYHWVFQSADVLTGLILLTSVPLVWRMLRKHELTWHALLAGTVLLAGLDSVVDALLPISCAPSADAGCQLADAHNVITMAHLIESNVAGVLLFVTPLLWWWFSRRKHSLLAGLSLSLAGVELAVGLAILLTRAFGVHIEGDLQRLYQVAIGAWLGYVLALSIQHAQHRTDTVELPQAAGDSSLATRTARR